ncbi:sarcosine oxidase subunit gamma [Mesorhizobium sp. NBSH29]|uniref:sarcosine oxidase subunit gamma n=1 Tax=Mesorhizobium sp. NBSH29 TaxID=2654249 RepID=UPI00189643D5|nr:sarcosine oxidase subunit gamma family protein [Mesorhizobium sp. NBSH29]QPC85772.1 sarcosine oxidase subunit gamma [Mesorhizobium sp. NBSH29]
MNAPVTSFAAVSVAVLPPVARLNLRIEPADLATASSAFGLPLPRDIGQGVFKGDRAAWCLGPDEWLLHAPETEQAVIVADFAEARATAPHSLTVISDRERTIAITGPRAQELLSVGCPLDLSRMAPGTAKRTLFDSAQVVLIRDADDAFRLEVWRSFFPHVSELLDIALREFACGL